MVNTLLFKSFISLCLSIPILCIGQIKWEKYDSSLPADEVKFLDISYADIDTIPLSAFINLEGLSMVGCGLKSIPVEIYEMKQLRILDLKLNKIKTLDEQISQLENLEELYLTFNELKDIEVVQKSTKLKKLGVGYNRLKTSVLHDIPKNIVELELSGNKIKVDQAENYFPKVVRHLELRWIKIANPDFSNYDNLEYLDLSSGKFNIISLKIGRALDSLVLNDLSIKDLSDLPIFGIEYLSLRANQLSEINSFICQFPSLQFLDLAYNQIDKVSDLRSCNKFSIRIIGNEIAKEESELEEKYPNIHFDFWDERVRVPHGI